MLRNLFLATATLACAAPAAAAVTVIGSSAARMCYEAAEAEGQRSGIEHCDKALRDEALTQENLVATHVNRGILKFRKGAVDAALQDFDQAIRLNPRQPEAYLNKGVVLLGRPNGADAAIPLFTLALENRTRKPALAYYARAAANEDLGNVRAAYHDYKRANEADPEWSDPALELTRFTVRPN